MEFIREIPQSVQTLQIATNLFWRGVFGQLFIGAYMAWCHSEDLWGSIQAVGVAGLWMMILSTLATICLMNPLRLAPVADVMAIHAALPFLTALFALAFIRGKPHSTRSSTDMFSEECTGTSIAVLLLLFAAALSFCFLNRMLVRRFVPLRGDEPAFCFQKGSVKNTAFSAIYYSGQLTTNGSRLSTGLVSPACSPAPCSQPYPAFKILWPLTFNKAIIIGPRENSPRSVRRVRSRR